ncbi:MAG: pilus assembly protein [Anaerolineae bacterium]|nr:pilus assembly protein [Anaerolineae bacterium]
MKLFQRLIRDRRAIAMTEFALAAPVFLTAGLWGLETANLAITHMRLSQAAMQIADNASRIGDTSMFEYRKIYESDINDIFVGANIQAGNSIDLFEHGRVILSSLEGDSSGDQSIHWQRCMGAKEAVSSFGLAGDTGITGMGPPGEEVMAMPDDAVMFVEVVYDYQPLVTDALVSDTTIRTHAAFTVRSSRDLTQIYQRDSAKPDPISDCNTYNGYKASVPENKVGHWSWNWG